MPITLANGTTTVTLPDDSDWIDEYGLSPMALNVETASNGAMIAEFSKRLYGDPITLQSGTVPSGAAYACIDRATANTLKTMSRVLSDTPLTLTFDDGRTYSVIFDHTQNPAFSATRWMVSSYPVDDLDVYTYVLKLMVVTSV